MPDQDNKSDQNLWYELTKQVTPLAKPNQVRPFLAGVGFKPQKVSMDSQRESFSLPSQLSSLSDYGFLAGDDLIHMDKKLALRLRQGLLPVQGRLDLHGMKSERAFSALNNFIQYSIGQGRRCLLIITGKGNIRQGVLREEVPKWLNQPSLRPYILGFCHAMPKDGGEGALYLLLKRSR